MTSALSARQAADVLNCSDGYIRAAIRRGDLMALRVGSRFRIFPEHLGEFIKSRRYVPIDRNRPRTLVDYSAIKRRIDAARREVLS